MLPPHLVPHTVARIRPSTGTDAHNDQTLTYTVPPAASKDMAAWLQQDNRSGPISDGRVASEQVWLMLTNDTDVVDKDRIVFGSLTFEVDGPPGTVYTPVGTHHLEVTLKIVTG